MDKKKILKDLKLNYEDASQARDDNLDKVAKWLDVVNSKKYGNEKPYKSQYVSDLTKKLLSWQIPALVDPLVNNKDMLAFKPMTFKDTPITEQEQKIATYDLFQANKHYEFITDLVNKIIKEGTCFVKLGWEFKEDYRLIDEPVYQINPATGQEEIVDIKTVRKKITVKNNPTHLICDLENIVVDPTCEGDIEKANFIIHDFDTDLSTLKQDGRYKNLDKLETKIAQLETEDRYYDTHDKEADDISFEFNDRARKKLTIHEYWGRYDINNDGIAEPIVCAWCNDVILRLEENPLPDKSLPFVKADYIRKPKEIYGEPLASLTGKIQHIDSVLKRGVFDDLKRVNNGQLGVKKGAIDDKNFNRMKKGLDFYYNTSMNDIWVNEYKPMASSIFKVLEDNQYEAESLTGVKAFNTGSGGNSLGSTAAAVNATMSSSGKREMHIIRGIAETCIIPMIKKWLSYSREFREPHEIEIITDNPYVPVEQSLAYDVSVNIESAEVKQQKIQSMGFLLQTMGPNMPHEVQQMLLARYVKLNGELDLAKQIETYQPQPDPMQQQMQQLQMQLLAAQVELERARAANYAADVPYKQAKTEHIKSDKDLKDLNYISNATGIDHNQKLEMEDAKGYHKVQQEALKGEVDLQKNIALNSQNNTQQSNSML